MRIKENIRSYLVFASAFLAACLLSFVILSYGASIFVGDKTPEQTAAKKRQLVIYIHGWEPEENTSYDEEMQILQATFPGQEIELYDWNAKGSFDNSLALADRTAEQLAEKIASLPESECRELILLGHSLGGRIAIKTMASPLLQGKPIRYGIFLAAAIPHDDSDIAKAIKNSLEPNIVVYNRQDYVLRHVYSLFGESGKDALGAFGYAFPFYHKDLIQHEISMETPQVKSLEEYLSRMEKHFAVSYLKELADIVKNRKENASAVDDILDDSTSREAIERINVMQDRPNIPIKIILELGRGETVDSFAHWKLQKIKTDLYRIVDPFDYQRASGSEQAMRMSFQKIREQLTAKQQQ